ncbi:unnamed protein product [Fusarium graminearum]|nr:unnamed protein product [Fusarium graminearum]
MRDLGNIWGAIHALKSLLGIIDNLVLDVAKSLTVKTLGIVEDLTTAVVEALDQLTIIWIIVKLYNIVAGDELSIVDLILLVTVALVALLYMVATGTTPI